MHEQTIRSIIIPMIRMPAPIPTSRIKLGCFPFREITGAAGDEGLCGRTSTGGFATKGAVN